MAPASLPVCQCARVFHEFAKWQRTPHKSTSWAFTKSGTMDKKGGLSLRGHNNKVAPEEPPVEGASSMSPLGRSLSVSPTDTSGDLSGAVAPAALVAAWCVSDAAQVCLMQRRYV